MVGEKIKWEYVRKKKCWFPLSHFGQKVQDSGGPQTLSRGREVCQDINFGLLGDFPANSGAEGPWSLHTAGESRACLTHLRSGSPRSRPWVKQSCASDLSRKGPLERPVSNGGKQERERAEAKHGCGFKWSLSHSLHLRGALEHKVHFWVCPPSRQEAGLLYFCTSQSWAMGSMVGQHQGSCNAHGGRRQPLVVAQLANAGRMSALPVKALWEHLDEASIVSIWAEETTSNGTFLAVGCVEVFSGPSVPLSHPPMITLHLKKQLFLHDLSFPGAWHSWQG